jgi:hypothetical protein
MKKFLKILILSTLAISAGCANFNPRNNPRIENQNGKIEDIRSNQNGVMAEIGKLRQEFAIQNSKLKEIQNGMINLNAAVSRNENTGIQIIQGDGALIFVFSIIVIAMLLFYYRDRAIKSEKTSEIMAREIAKVNDPELNDNILLSAIQENKGKDVYNIIKKQLEKI